MPSRGSDALQRASYWNTAVSARTEYEVIAVDLERTRISKPNLLLAALPSQDFGLLKPHLREVVLAQGMILQEQGESIDHVYFPHDGIVSLLAVMQQGVAIETATIGR